MDSCKQLSVIGILTQALLIPSKNKKLMIPVILLSFIPSSLLLSLGDHVSINSLLLDFIVKLYVLSNEDPITPQFYTLLLRIKRDAMVLVHVDMVFVLALYAMSVFSAMLVVYASAAVHSGKQLTSQDLQSWIKGSWKASFLTQVYFTLLFVGYTVLSASLIAALVLNSSNSIWLSALACLVIILARVLYVYLAMKWTVGVVISVLEEGSHGLEALAKAGEIMKERRAQGFAIAIILMLFEGFCAGSYGLGMIKDQINDGAQQRRGLAVVNLPLLLNIYSQMVCTVFYYECKRSNEKDVGVIIGEYI